MAIIQSDTDDGTASDKRSTARPAMEAVGNFVLVFAFGIAIATHSWFAPLLIGAPLVAMVSSRNRVPDAYYNPSLTFAMLMRGRIAFRDALPFWLIQLGSGLLAAMLVCAMVGPRQLAVTAATVKGSTLVAALALELVFTSALCFVAVDVSRSNSRTANDYNGWPIALGGMASHRDWRRHQRRLLSRNQLRRRCAWNTLVADAMDIPSVPTALGNRRHDHIREPRGAMMSHALFIQCLNLDLTLPTSSTGPVSGCSTPAPAEQYLLAGYSNSRCP